MNINRYFTLTSMFVLLNISAYCFAQSDSKHFVAETIANVSDTHRDESNLTARDSAKDYMQHNSVDKIDAQIKIMNELHMKALNAKTAEERNALKAEHVKAMRDGMSMMAEMSKSLKPSMMNDVSSDHSSMRNAEKDNNNEDITSMSNMIG